MATDLNLVFGACIALDKEGSQRKRQAKRKKRSLFGFFYSLIAGGLGFIAWWKEGVDVLFVCYCVSAVLCPIFFHLYRIRLKYYRNTILYGFYEYAVTREKSGESKNSEN